MDDDNDILMRVDLDDVISRNYDLVVEETYPWITGINISEMEDSYLFNSVLWMMKHMNSSLVRDLNITDYIYAVANEVSNRVDSLMIDEFFLAFL